jgi:hypothetical protein
MSKLVKTEHALLSPSAAFRWLTCTPSARLEATFPDATSAYASEGSLAHELCELVLRRNLTTALGTQIGSDKPCLTDAEYTKRMDAITANPLYSAEMKSHALDYLEFIKELLIEAQTRCIDAVVQVEQKLNLTDWVPEGFGTGDCVIIADKKLDIVDLKYGKGVMVSATNNKQMMLYALGALREFEYLYDIRFIRMSIFQPRLSNISVFEIPAEDLRRWAKEELAPKARLAFEGKGDYMPGDHCRFCRAKARCRALAEKNLELAKHEFKDVTLLSDDDIADVLSRAGMFTFWLNAVQEYAFNEALAGKKWSGFKLVEGRSVRSFSNQDDAAKALITAGIPEAIIYERKLLGITAMEKAVGKKQFDAILADFIVKPAGKPALVPESDKRPEWNSAATDFANLN